MRCAAGSVAVVLGTLSLLASPSASGQVIWPDRSNEHSPEDRSRLDALRRSQAEADAKESAEMKAFRERLLRSAPLPEQRNVLLGRWRVEGATRPRSEKDQFMALLTNPGAGCEMLFGSGVTEFAPTTFSTSGLAGLAQGPIAYRSAGPQRIAAIPAKSTKVWGFDVTNPNRILGGDNCVLVRIEGAAPAAQGGPSNRAPAPSMAEAPHPMPGATLALPPSTASHPPPQACRNTLLDKLGMVGVDQVRAMARVRFTEAAIEGKVPNTNNLRLDLRGSACDEDPRVKASLYDFDANGMLQSITLVWERPPGPAPAPIFQERVQALLRFHPSLPQPQTSGRLKGDTSLGRLILQDMPERSLLLEAYTAKK